jgi:hypothetical protein
MSRYEGSPKSSPKSFSEEPRNTVPIPNRDSASLAEGGRPKAKGQNPKSEGPKSEGNPKSEIRNPKSDLARPEPKDGRMAGRKMQEGK